MGVAARAPSHPATIRPRLDQGTLLKLARFNTPAVYNGWEQITARDASREGINREPLTDFMPEMGPIIGYAVTVVIEPSNPEHPRTSPGAWPRYWRYVSAQPGPKSHSHATDARLAAHDCRIERDSRERKKDASQDHPPRGICPEKTCSAAVLGGAIAATSGGCGSGLEGGRNRFDIRLETPPPALIPRLAAADGTIQQLSHDNRARSIDPRVTGHCPDAQRSSRLPRRAAG